MDTEQIIEQLKAERNRLEQAIAVLGGSGSLGRTAGHRGPRHMSEEARRRISEAQKKRWAREKRIGKSATTVGTSSTRKSGSGISAAGRKRLSEMMKRRWAERLRKAA